MSHPGGRKRVQMRIQRAQRPRSPRPSSALPSPCCLKMASWESCEAQTIDDRNKPRTSDKTNRFRAPQDSWEGRCGFRESKTFLERTTRSLSQITQPAFRAWMTLPRVTDPRPLLAHHLQLKVKTTQATPNHLRATERNFWSSLIWSDFNQSVTLDVIQGGKTLGVKFKKNLNGSATVFL